MNVEDVVQWADNLIFDRTGANLTALQEAILTGVWQRQKYLWRKSARSKRS